MAENTEGPKKSRSAIWIIILVVLFIVKIAIRQERKQSAASTKEMAEMMQQFAVERNSYKDLKTRILNLSYDDISISHKEDEVLAVLYDIALDSASVVTMAITVDSTASILVPNKTNKIYTTVDEDVLAASDTIFDNAVLAVNQMQVFTGTVVEPTVNHLKVYVRTNDLKTYVQDIDIESKDLSIDEKNMLKGFSSLFTAMNN